MRLVSAVLFVALTGSFALADEAKPADPKPEVTKKKVAYRVVKMLPETGQVLLFDRFHGTHVVAEVGQTLDGYVVQDIDEDEVTLVGDSGAQVILTAPAPKHEPKKVAKQAAEPVDPYAEGDAAGSKAQASGTPADPYADGDGKTTAPVDPYAEPAPPKTPGEGGVRVAKAPSAGAPIVDSGAPAIADPYSDAGIAAFADAVGATPTPTAAAPSPDKAAAKPATKGKAGKAGKGGKATPRTVSAKTGAAPDVGAALASAATGGDGATTDPSATAPRAAATTAPAAAATTPPGTAASGSAPGTIVIARSELDAALGDFGKLAGAFRATFTPDGLRFDALNEGTILTKIGLRKGDVIASVDGQPLKSLDDAASLYARAGTVRSTTLQVVRAGKPVTLRVAIQ